MRMTYKELKKRAEAFSYLSARHTGGLDTKGAAERLMAYCDRHEEGYPYMDRETWIHEERFVDPAMWELGYAILCGNELAADTPEVLRLDLGYMDDLDHKHFQEFIQGMVDVMVSGINKGYTQQLSHQNEPGWQTSEIRAKLEEFNASMAGKHRDLDQAERCITKIATAAYVTWRDRIIATHPQEELD